MEFLDQVVVVDQDTLVEKLLYCPVHLVGDLVIQDLLSVVNLVDSMLSNMVEFSFFPRPMLVIYQPIYHRLQFCPCW